MPFITASPLGKTTPPWKILPGRRICARYGPGVRWHGSVRIPAFKWVNTAPGDIEFAIVGAYRVVSSKHVPRYLASSNTASTGDPASPTIPRLTWASVRTPPMPYRLLKLAEVHAKSGNNIAGFIR